MVPPKHFYLAKQFTCQKITTFKYILPRVMQLLGLHLGLLKSFTAILIETSADNTTFGTHHWQVG